MGKKSDPPAPDYTPMANASAESARLAAELGQKQLDENKRQYEENKVLTAKVVDKQLDLMDQSKAQGDAYFENWKTGRDVTDQLRDEVMVDKTFDQLTSRQNVKAAQANAAKAYDGLSDDQKKFGDDQAARIVDSQNQIINNGQQQVKDAATGMTTAIDGTASGLKTDANGYADKMTAAAMAAAGGIGANMERYGGEVSKAVDLYTAGNSGIIEKYGKDIEEDVGRAVSDARAGQSQATNQAIRQAIRYGVNLPDAAEGTTLGQAQMLAGAANGTRVASTNNYRDIVGKSVGMRQALLDTSINAASQQAGIEAQAAMAGGQMKMAGASDAAHMTASGVTAAAGMNANAAATAAGMKSGAAASAEEAKTLANNQALGLKAASIDKTANIAAMDRDMVRQDEATNLAKKMDVAGLYSGMPGAGTGAYSMANNAGSSAVGNQTTTSGQYLQGMNAGTGTIMNGRSLAQSGLGAVLNSQTSVYSAGSQSDGTMGAIGTIGGAAITAY